MKIDYIINQKYNFSEEKNAKVKTQLQSKNKCNKSYNNLVMYDIITRVHNFIMSSYTDIVIYQYIMINLQN